MPSDIMIDFLWGVFMIIVLMAAAFMAIQGIGILIGLWRMEK